MQSRTTVSDGEVLHVNGLTKRFGGTEALRGVDFAVRRGEIHALLGANGAGKSTLIKILAGVYPSDGGSIEVEGQPLDEGSRRNIAFVHQDLGLIESMSVGENMAMGYGYPRRWKLIDWAAVDRAAEVAIARLGSALPLDRPVSELSRAEKSIVAIARALVNDPKLLVLDEPTASLPEADVSRLFSVLFRLRDRGVGIIHVTHRLDEVFRIADALTVLRDGRTAAVYRPVAISPEQLVTDIVGRAPASRNFKRPMTEGRPALAVKGLRVGTAGPVSFRVAAGEIVGLAGLRGAGHEAVGRVLGGVLCCSAGTIAVDGKEAG